MTIKEKIFKALEDNPELRQCSDKKLGEYLVNNNANPINDIRPLTYETYCEKEQLWLYAVYGLPNPESIGRNRRQYYEEHNLLKPDPKDSDRGYTQDKKVSKNVFEHLGIDPLFVFLG